VVKGDGVRGDGKENKKRKTKKTMAGRCKRNGVTRKGTRHNRMDNDSQMCTGHQRKMNPWNVGWMDNSSLNSIIITVYTL